MGIVNTALALAGCGAPNTNAANEIKGEAISGQAGFTEGFKKELEDCEAGMAMVQQPPQCGSTANTEENGIQEAPKAAGVTSGVNGASCILEGLEMPVNPSDTPPAAKETAIPESAAQSESVKQEPAAQGQKAGVMSENNAWMQHATAGTTPAITQDEILEAVGAYLEPAAADAESAGKQLPVTQTAASQSQTASQPQQVAAAPVPDQESAMQKPNETAEPKQTADTQKPGTAAAEPRAEVLPKESAAEPVLAAQGRASANLKGSTDTDKQRSDMPGKSETQVKAEAGTMQKAAQTGTAEENTAKAESTTAVSQKHETLPRAGIEADAVKPQAAGAEATQLRSAEFAAKTTEAKAADHPQYTKENVLRIVDKVSTRSADGKYDFDVELKPDFLGKVSIKLTMEDGSIRMQIKTDDVSVKNMLSGQTSSMQDALKEKGITLTSVDISYESQASLSGEKQPYEQNGGGRQNATYYAQAETSGTQTSADLYGLYIGNSSVEFLA